MKQVKGDIIELFKSGQFNVMIQGCNCWNRMGSGIALQIKENFPEAWEVDRHTIKGYREKLGRFTTATVGDNQRIYNAYTQFNYGYDGLLYTDYKAVRQVFRKLYDVLNCGTKNKMFKICYPKIGCGLGGGDWEIVSNIINEELRDLDHTYVEYDQ